MDNKLLNKVIGILKSITDMCTLEALPLFCKLAQTDDVNIYFGMAAEELLGESSFSLERSKDVFEYLTKVNKNRTDMPHSIREELFSKYNKEPFNS